MLGGARSLSAPYVSETLRRVLNRAKVLSPVDTGRMRNSLRTAVRTTQTAVIGSLTASRKPTIWVHDGTRPHIIRARRRKALRFVSKRGQVVIVKQVRHPGTRPRPFIWRALVEIAVPRGFVVRRSVVYRGGSRLG